MLFILSFMWPKFGLALSLTEAVELLPIIFTKWLFTVKDIYVSYMHVSLLSAVIRACT